MENEDVNLFYRGKVEKVFKFQIFKLCTFF